MPFSFYEVAVMYLNHHIETGEHVTIKRLSELLNLEYTLIIKRVKAAVREGYLKPYNGYKIPREPWFNLTAWGEECLRRVASRDEAVLVQVNNTFSTNPKSHLPNARYRRYSAIEYAEQIMRLRGQRDQFLAREDQSASAE